MQSEEWPKIPYPEIPYVSLHHHSLSPINTNVFCSPLHLNPSQLLLNMEKLSFLSLSLCLLVLFQGSLAISRSRSEEYSRRQNECQFDRLQALEPDSRIQAEAGVIESWNPNHDQFQCAGVAVVRRTIEPNGLHLPSYTNTPQLMYIVRGTYIYIV